MKRQRRPMKQLLLTFQLELPLEAELQRPVPTLEEGRFEVKLALLERDARAHMSIEAALEDAIARAAREATPCTCGCSPTRPHCQRCGQRLCSGTWPCACVDGGFQSGDDQVDDQVAEAFHRSREVG